MNDQKRRSLCKLIGVYKLIACNRDFFKIFFHPHLALKNDYTKAYV